MTDEPQMNDIDLAAMGHRAGRELIETEDVIKALLNEKTKRWMASNDAAERERLHAEVRAMNEFREELQTRATQGAAAKNRLDAKS